ncbi:hypothetical protein E4U53_002640 [Claviceps sorghi]|nr:hypothetical protein E4U53_002640 [Claviceps sorghi]
MPVPARHSCPPSLLSPPSTTTTSALAQPMRAHASLHHTPSADRQRHVAEARAAVVASIGNLVDSELQSRAGLLHGNAAALDRQERDVLRATDRLRREREKLAREADGAARKIKELGNVQNWAEVLERGFLVLEETVRLADGGDDEDDGHDGSCSCSECGWSDHGDHNGRYDGARDGHRHGHGGPAEEEELDAEDTMVVDPDVAAESLHNRLHGTTLEAGKDTDPAMLSRQNGHLDVEMTQATDTEAQECVV